MFAENEGHHAARAASAPQETWVPQEANLLRVAGCLTFVKKYRGEELNTLLGHGRANMKQVQWLVEMAKPVKKQGKRDPIDEEHAHRRRI